MSSTIEMRKQLVLLTGATGFVGRNVLDELSREYEVRIAKSRAGALVEADFYNVDTVVHLAGVAHGRNRNSEDFFAVNSEFTRHLAVRAKENEVRRFIFLSSIAVFGLEAGSLSEGTIERPRSAYGESKLKGEKAAALLQNDSFQVVILRAPMIYGLDAPGNPLRLQKLIERCPRLPLGNINNRRSFIYIGNLSFLILKLVGSDLTGTFLVADPSPVSTTDFISFLGRANGKRPRLFKLPGFALMVRVLAPKAYSKLFGSLEIVTPKIQSMLSVDLPYNALPLLGSKVDG